MLVMVDIIIGVAGERNASLKQTRHLRLCNDQESIIMDIRTNLENTSHAVLLNVAGCTTNPVCGGRFLVFINCASCPSYPIVNNSTDF